MALRNQARRTACGTLPLFAALDAHKVLAFVSQTVLRHMNTAAVTFWAEVMAAEGAGNLHKPRQCVD